MREEKQEAEADADQRPAQPARFGIGHA